jgi:hypothetical protein
MRADIRALIRASNDEYLYAGQVARNRREANALADALEFSRANRRGASAANNVRVELGLRRAPGLGGCG